MKSIAGVTGYEHPAMTGGPIQFTLTDNFLKPFLAELEIMFLEIRTLLDSRLMQAQPAKNGKDYPLGQCLEIAKAVKHWLLEPDRTALSLRARSGHTALTEFCSRGGVFRRVWGDLRGKYFQNAFQLGSLYVDVANDTVVITKPKVEILPYTVAGISAIVDYKHYERIASNYWQGKFYPNFVLPKLAPYYPIIHITKKNHIRFTANSNYMVWMTLREQFRPSLNYLKVGTMPADLFENLQKLLMDSRLQPAKNPEEGKALALAACVSFRKKRAYLSTQKTHKSVATVNLANSLLEKASQQTNSKIHFQNYSQRRAKMSNTELPAIININGNEYSPNDLSVTEQEHIHSILLIDRKLEEHRQETAILQTARNAYSSALLSTLNSQANTPSN